MTGTLQALREQSTKSNYMIDIIEFIFKKAATKSNTFWCLLRLLLSEYALNNGTTAIPIASCSIYALRHINR